jgi:hypothetical protein
MENIDKAVRTSTTPEEKSKRFDFINNQLMEKYFELVWFARSNPDKARNNGEKELFETLTQKLGEISDKYPKEIQALCGDDSNWEHGFNSGILAYSRFLADYVSDMLFPDDDDLEDAIVLDGKKYIQIDG